MLAPIWVEIKSRGIGDIAAGLVRNNGDVVTYLALVRVAFERIERITYCHVR